MDASEEISGEFVVTCCDSSIVLEFVEEALDEVTLAVEGEIARQRNSAAGMGRNHRGDSPAGQDFDEGIGIVSFISDQSLRIEILKQWFCTGEIVGLSWRKHQFHGIAQRIDERVNFSAQSAA